jgi:hypothetical protein
VFSARLKPSVIGVLDARIACFENMLVDKSAHFTCGFATGVAE